jgi:hypothetical protein
VPVDLAEAAADLYAAPPDDFMALRKEFVAAARAAKDRDLGKAVGALRKPTVSAWLVNLLARDAEGREALAALAGLGEQLREAQLHLAADRLRELGRERRSAVADLVSRAVELGEAAGHSVGPAVEREVDETLVAAVADEAAAAAVMSGALTRALSYSGFGEVDLDAAVAVPEPVTRRGGPTVEPEEPVAETDPSVDEAADAERERLAAERERQAKERLAAERALAAAEAALAAAHEQAQRAEAEVVVSREQLDAAREALAAAEDQKERVDATLAAAEAEVDQSRRALAALPEPA